MNWPPRRTQLIIGVAVVMAAILSAAAFVLLAAAPPADGEVVKQDSTIIALAAIAAGGTLLTGVVSTVGTIFIARLNAQATTKAAADVIVAEKHEKANKAVADKAEEVRESLQVHRSVTDKKLDKIETLVNGGVEKLLRSVAVALRQVADTKHTQKADEAAAAAEQALADHIEQQAKVDEAARQDVRKQQPPPEKKTSIGLGQAVGEIGEDVKEVKEGVNNLLGNQSKEKS